MLLLVFWVEFLFLFLQLHITDEKKDKHTALTTGIKRKLTTLLKVLQPTCLDRRSRDKGKRKTVACRVGRTITNNYGEFVHLFNFCIVLPWAAEPSEISIYLNHMTNVFLQNHYHSRKAWNDRTLQRRLHLFSPTFPVFALSFPLTTRTINKVQKVNSQRKPNKTFCIIPSTHTLASSCSNLDISCLLEVWKTIFAHQMTVFPSNMDTRESSHFNAV